MNKLFAIGLILLLAGCAVGIQPGKTYPSDTFTVPLNYQETYRRADAMPRECLTDWTASGNIFTDNKTGIVRVTMPSYTGRDLMRVNLSQLPNGKTKVTVTASDNGIFDKGQVESMRKSIETGKPACRSPKYDKFQ